MIGKAPDYNEVFLDEGDVDMVAAMRSYKEAGFDGVFQPDHVSRIRPCTLAIHTMTRMRAHQVLPPTLTYIHMIVCLPACLFVVCLAVSTCVVRTQTPIVTLPPGLEGAAWHTGMAFAVGYMKAAAKAADYEFELPKSPLASL